MFEFMILFLLGMFFMLSLFFTSDPRIKLLEKPGTLTLYEKPCKNPFVPKRSITIIIREVKTNEYGTVWLRYVQLPFSHFIKESSAKDFLQEYKEYDWEFEEYDL